MKQESSKKTWIAVILFSIMGFMTYQEHCSESPKPAQVSGIATSSSTKSSTNLSTSMSDTDPVNDHSEEGIRQNILAATDDPKITYEQLKKNADKYEGEPWAFAGKVFQIQESGEHTFALISLDTWGNKIVAVKANFTTDFVEKDQVYVVGYLAGDYSYTSVAQWSLTVPAMDARAILKPSDAARIKAGKVIPKQQSLP
jgi:hypothetical protein